MQTIVQDSEALGYYVYGVIAGPGADLPAGPGVEPGAPVVCVGEGDLAAVVSPVPLERFDPEQLEARLSDLAWLEPRARAHQAVLSGISAPVAPLRFGTIFCDEAGVRAMLRANGAIFRSALARLTGRREWGVKIVADAQQVADYVAASSERVIGLMAQRARMSSGAAYLIQKKLDMLILEESRRLAEGCVRESHTRLA
ncbi:GvpL/GvpF family gas vesicle protein, partial [Oscillochloris sp. ZM17-4]|uniref:GvpL/GvpF family gas vesicle protein n=1 Tax=Oscillochloris sp. ZM17-4 TaxID=2866714 RepID=UPI001C72F94E